MNDRPQRNQVTAIVREAMEDALEWRMLMLFTTTVLVTSAVAGVPAWRVFAGAFDHSPRAGEIARSFDLLAFEDVGMAFARSVAPVTGALAIATLLSALSWPFLAGIAMGAARGERPQTFAAVLQAGIAYYTRMLRIGLVSIAPLALFGVAAAGAFGGARYYAKRAILESQATLAWRGALAFTLLLFIVVHATIELGRAAFGVEPELRSGWRALQRGMRLMVRHPLRVLGAYLGPTLVSYVAAIPLLIARLRLSGPSAAELVIAFVVTQLVVASLGWGRAARLLALTRLARLHFQTSLTPADAPEAVGDAVHVIRSGA
jgi:hypothetical protein